MPTRRARALAFAAFSQTFAGSPALADPMQPTKNWVVDYADTECDASREYGSGDDALVLLIRPSPNGDSYELLLSRPHHGPKFAEELEGSVDFGGGPTKAWLLHYGGKARDVNVYKFRIPAAEMARGRNAASVRLRVEGGPDVTLKLTIMAALLEGLDKCTVDLKRYWNMDDAGEARVATQAKGSLVGLFSDNDYPSEALMRGQQGASQFLLLIDEKGNVAGCYVQRASGVPALDGMGCYVIKERLKMTPALDAQGHAIRSSAVTPPIKWVM